MAKGKSWAGAEDECLCCMWLHASEDLITVVRHFIRLLPGKLTSPEHSMSFMQARWVLINTDAAKF